MSLLRFPQLPQNFGTANIKAALLTFILLGVYLTFTLKYISQNVTVAKYQPINEFGRLVFIK